MISRNVEVGQTVAAGSETPPLFLVAADLTVTHIDAILSEKDIGEVKLGDKASITVEVLPEPSLCRRGNANPPIAADYPERRDL